MISRRTMLQGTLGALAVSVATTACSDGTSLASSTSALSHIKAATAITQVYGDGLKFVAVQLEYDTDIDNAKLSASAFKVAGRTITNVYASAQPASSSALPASKGNGRYVIIEMSPDDAAAALWVSDAVMVGGAAGKPASSQKQGQSTQPTVKKAAASVVQAAAVTTASGSSYPASSAKVATSSTINLVVDEFKQYEYHDPKTGETVRYNLFLPKDYEVSGTSYPMVLFLHDAGPLSTVTTTTLVQGLGAICWASPQDQAKRPAIVVAPQYDVVTVGTESATPTAANNTKTTPWVDATANLVEHLTGQYRVDTDRIYATGQSMGAMMSLVLNIQQPDLFAASYIVAGQWDPAQCKPLASKKLWVIVSKGDDNAYPTENAMMTTMEKYGARITRATWNGKSSTAQLDAEAMTMAAKGYPINYTGFIANSVIPSGEPVSTIENHLNTWRLAYDIDAIRDWIFRQAK